MGAARGSGAVREKDLESFQQTGAVVAVMIAHIHKCQPQFKQHKQRQQTHTFFRNSTPPPFLPPQQTWLSHTHTRAHAHTDVHTRVSPCSPWFSAPSSVLRPDTMLSLSLCLCKCLLSWRLPICFHVLSPAPQLVP